MTVTPRGLAILRGAGLASWMAACPPDRSASVHERPVRPLRVPSVVGGGLDRELVGILADMVLAPRTCSLEVMR